MANFIYDKIIIGDSATNIDGSIGDILTDIVYDLNLTKGSSLGNTIYNQSLDIQFKCESLSLVLHDVVSDIVLLEQANVQTISSGINYFEMPDYNSLSYFERSPETQALLNDIISNYNNGSLTAGEIATMSAMALVELVKYEGGEQEGPYFYGEGWNNGNNGLGKYKEASNAWDKNHGMNCIGLAYYGIFQYGYLLGLNSDEVYNKIFGNGMYYGSLEGARLVSEGATPQVGDILRRGSGHVAIYAGKDSNGVEYIIESNNYVSGDEFVGVRVAEYKPNTWLQIYTPDIYSNGVANISVNALMSENKLVTNINSYVTGLQTNELITQDVYSNFVYDGIPDYSSLSGDMQPTPEQQALINSIYQNIDPNLSDERKIAIISGLSIMYRVKYSNQKSYALGWNSGDGTIRNDDSNVAWQDVNGGIHCNGFTAWCQAQVAYAKGMSESEIYNLFYNRKNANYGALDIECIEITADSNVTPEPGDLLLCPGHIVMYVGKGLDGKEYIMESSPGDGVKPDGTRITEYDPEKYYRILKPSVYSDERPMQNVTLSYNQHNQNASAISTPSTIAAPSTISSSSASSTFSGLNGYFDEYNKMLQQLPAGLTYINPGYNPEVDIEKIINNLPADLNTNRAIAVLAALSLVNKVPYLQGGKKYKLGIDETATTAVSQFINRPGFSPTTGIDCSGLTLYTGLLVGSYHGYDDGFGGEAYEMVGEAVSSQISSSRATLVVNLNISTEGLENVQPGDYALFDDNSHIAIVVGRDENGNILVVESSSINAADWNNNQGRGVVITNALDSGFTRFYSPKIYNESVNTSGDTSNIYTNSNTQNISTLNNTNQSRTPSSPRPSTSNNTSSNNINTSTNNNSSAPVNTAPQNTTSSSAISNNNTTSQSTTSSSTTSNNNTSANTTSSSSSNNSSASSKATTNTNSLSRQRDEMAEYNKTANSNDNTYTYNNTSETVNTDSTVKVVDETLIDPAPSTDTGSTSKEIDNYTIPVVSEETQDTTTPEPTTSKVSNAGVYVAGSAAAATAGYFGYQKMKESKENNYKDEDEDDEYVYEYPEDDEVKENKEETLGEITDDSVINIEQPKIVEPNDISGRHN